VRIAELAEHVGVPTSTVRYYERVGLLGPPARTESGYRDYDDADAARLLFVARARRMGLSCEQIVELLPVWAGANCAAARERVVDLIEEKRAEVAARIHDLELFAGQLDTVRARLERAAPPGACRSDLSCCVPATRGSAPVPLEPTARRPADRSTAAGKRRR
jgi:DNA-binding transcriptional MerR regulator